MKKKASTDSDKSLADDLRAEYRFDYRKAKPNRFATMTEEDRTVVVLDPDGPGKASGQGADGRLATKIPDQGQTLRNNLAHSRTAYIFAIRCLPDPARLKDVGPISANGFTFTAESQILSMLIELGWAFFCRYEGCLEAHLKRNRVPLSKKMSLLGWFDRNDVNTPMQLRSGLSEYRRIRNSLHHDDGAPIDGSDRGEIHLLPEQMENFYTLFVWCADQIDRKGQPNTAVDAQDPTDASPGRSGEAKTVR